MIENEQRLVAYAVSTAVGSGKTRAAIRYMAASENGRQNFIYVAPTIKLVDQTALDLADYIEGQGADREVSLIHSQSKEIEDASVSEEAKLIINGADQGSGAIVIITTTTFLRIMCEIRNAEGWRVIVDEGFSPVEFLKYHLGVRAEEGLDHFLKHFTIKAVTNLVEAAPGQAQWLNDLAAGVIRRAGEQNATLNDLASAVSNPGIICELLTSEKVRSILNRTYSAPAVGSAEENTAAPESIFTIACCVSPAPLTRFAEVVFMSALFEETMLYLMWSTLFGVKFIEHPAFPAASLRNIHVDQGPHVAIGHLLHPDDLSSKHNLEKSIVDGSAYEKRQGLRVIDRLVSLCSKHFEGSRFLLQTNDVYGYVAGSSSMPSNAVKVPTSSHGLNEFQGFDNVAALAVTNPVPQETQWIMAKTGLSKVQTTMAFRIHTTYQAVGRSSIRRASPTRETKTFLTVGRADADLLHRIFEGSTWLGQIGDMNSLSHTRVDYYTNTVEYKTSLLIRDCLEGLSEDVRRVSIRGLKQKTPGSDAISKATWTRAVQTAAERSDDWAVVGQSFVRKDGSYYGFSVVEGGYDSSAQNEAEATV